MEFLTEELNWCQRSGSLRHFVQWWWELRLHPRYGTLEIRVPDAQASLHGAAGVVALAHSLCCWLTARYDAADLRSPDPTWRIEQNRWSACRDGLNATFADLQTGHQIPVRERITELIEQMAPIASQIGCAVELAALRGRIGRPTASNLYRAIAAESGLVGLMHVLVGEFLDWH